MQCLRHELPLDWLPGPDYTQRILNIARGCARRRVSAAAGGDQTLRSTFSQPAKGAQLVVTYTTDRVVQDISLTDRVLTQRSILDRPAIEMYCEGTQVVNEAYPTIPPATYALMSFWVAPGRYGESVTTYLSPFIYCPARREWRPLCENEKTFWAISAAPIIGDEPSITTLPFEQLIAALREAPAA